MYVFSWGGERREGRGGEERERERERGRGGGMESSRDTNTGGILPFLYIV